MHRKLKLSSLEKEVQLKIQEPSLESNMYRCHTLHCSCREIARQERRPKLHQNITKASSKDK